MCGLYRTCVYMLSSPPGIASTYISLIKDRFSGTFFFFFFFKEWDLVTGEKEGREGNTICPTWGISTTSN